MAIRTFSRQSKQLYRQAFSQLSEPNLVSSQKPSIFTSGISGRKVYPLFSHQSNVTQSRMFSSNSNSLPMGNKWKYGIATLIVTIGGFALKCAFPEKEHENIQDFKRKKIKDLTSQANFSAAIEGMPGAGKTSTIFSLVYPLQNKGILFSEVNPEPGAEWRTSSEKMKGGIYHQLWVDRMAIIEAHREKLGTIVFDRSFFSNLAFTYAFGKIKGSDSYMEQLNFYQEDLSRYSFDVMIILDVSPETSLRRREKQRANLSYPWNSIDFLTHLRRFYLEVLPTLVKGHCIVIDTENLSIEEVKSTLHDLLSVEQTEFPKNQNLSREKTILLKFGRKHNLLREEASPVTMVLGYPTVYFGKHSVQLDGDNPVFLGNERLKSLLL